MNIKLIVTHLRLYFLVGIFVTCLANADEDVIDDPILHKMAMDTRTAILNNDNSYILKYVAAEGIYFLDTVYSKEQIKDLLNDKNSWLYKNLYLGDSSKKQFFENIRDIEVKIYKRGANAIIVTYLSKNASNKRSLENCYIKIKDNWYLDGIFSCE